MSSKPNCNGYDGRGNPDLSWWLGEIRKGIRYRKKAAMEARWATWRKYYRGDWSPNVMPSNLFFKMLRTIVPRVYFRNPSIVLSPGQPGMDMLVFTQLLQRLDNQLIRMMRVKQEMKAIVQDTFLFGTGVGKLGFGAEFTHTPEMGGTVSPVSSKGERFEYHSYIKGDMPWFMRVKTGQFIVPAGCDTYSTARWSAVWIRRPVYDVQADPRLKGAKNVKASVFSDEGTPASRMLDDPDLVDLFEVRDKKFGVVFVFDPANLTKPLYFSTDKMQNKGRLSTYPLIFNQDDEQFWGVPDAKILEPLQLEAVETRTQIMKHRRLAIARILAKRNSLKEDAKLKLVSEEVSPVIDVDGEMSDVLFSEGVPIPPELFKAFDLVYADLRETVGFSRNQFGDYASGSNDKSATESQLVDQAANIRVDERRDMVADMLTDVVEDMHEVMFNEWRDEQVVDLVGPNGLPIWVTFRPRMLKVANATVAIDPESTVPLSSEKKQAIALEMYNILKTNPLIDPDLLTRYLLQEVAGSKLDFLIRMQTQMMGGAAGSNPSNPISAPEYVQLLQRMGVGQTNAAA